MSRLQSLKVFMNQRMTAAVEEIFGHFERTMAEYEDEMNRRHFELIDMVSTPEAKLRTEADVQQLLVVKEEQQEWSSSLDQEDPELPHIKEEQLWTEEQLQGLEEADIKFSFTPAKSEDDEEEAQSSRLHQRQTKRMETEADGEDCGGPEPGRKSDPDTNDKTEDSSEPETDDSDDWKQNKDRQSGSNSRKKVLDDDEEEVQSSEPSSEPSSDDSDDWKQNRHRQSRSNSQKKVLDDEEEAQSSEHSSDDSDDWNQNRDQQSGSNSRKKVLDERCYADKHLCICTECGKRFANSTNLKVHKLIHTGLKPFCCKLCSKRFPQQRKLMRHMKRHVPEQTFSCSVCDKSFRDSGDVKRHMGSHTGEALSTS